MAEIVYCKYHQQTPARWYCQQCHIEFCDSCVNDQINSDPPQCALCNASLYDYGLEALIPPFWHKISLFFKLPFSLSTMIFIVGLILAAYVAVNIPIVGWLLVVVMLPVIFFKYAFLFLQNIADGHLRAPRLLELSEEKDYDIVFKQVFILILLFAPMTKIAELGPFLFYAWYLFVLFIIPATVMVLAVEQSLFQAINPFKLLIFIKRIGAAYLGLYLLISIVSGGPTIIYNMVDNVFAREWVQAQEDKLNHKNPNAYRKIQNDYKNNVITYLVPFYFILEMYFTLVIFTIMGYVLLKYHNRFGFNISGDLDEAFGDYKKPPKVHPIMKDIEVLIKENQLQKALKTLQLRLPEHANDVQMRMRFHKLLFMTKNHDVLLNHGEDFINLLLQSNDKAYAVEIFSDCIKVDEQFVLKDNSLYLPLAQTMFEVRAYKPIVKLLSGYHKRFPNDNNIQALYLILAKSLSDGLNMDKKALGVLSFLLKNYPQGSHTLQIKEYFMVIKKVANDSTG